MGNRRVSLAARLKQMREAAGFNKSTLAKAAGVDRHTIRRIETGQEKNPKLETMQALARACGRDPAELVSAVQQPSDIGGAISELERLEALRPTIQPPIEQSELEWAAEQTALWQTIPPDAEAVIDLIRWRRAQNIRRDNT